jgi:hypothetical protein
MVRGHRPYPPRALGFNPPWVSNLFQSRNLTAVAYHFHREYPELDAQLGRRLAYLGVLYAYGGMTEINPMAMRVLDRLHAEGKALSMTLPRAPDPFHPSQKG